MFLGLILSFVSCKKEVAPTCTDGIQNQDEVYVDCGGSCTACPIEYPTTGPIGQNLLYGEEDTLELIASNYSFKATVAPGSSLEIVSHNVAGDPFLYGLNEGWNITNATEGLSFKVASHGTAELIINLSSTSGTALIEYFENGSSVTKQKVIVWS